MNVSAPFIRRPVATSLLCLGLLFAGLLGAWLLPVAAMPDVDVPTIKVSAALSGASPETVAMAVAGPLERTLGRIAGLTEMSSVSSGGGVDIRLTFDFSRNVNGAARDVQAAINAARSDLPADLSSSPSYRVVTSADAPALVLALTSRQATPAQMYAAASTTFSQMLSQVDGVGQVDLAGSSMPVLRIGLDPAALNQRGLSFEQVRRAVVSAVSNQPVGSFDVGDRYWQLATNGQLATVDDFKSLVVARQGGSIVRLGDFATIVEGVRDPSNAALANGEPAVLVLVRRKPGANLLHVIEGVKQRLPMLRAILPGDMQAGLIVDRTTTTRAALHAAGHSLAMAAVLVAMVMLLFLRGLRMALIASVAAPISLIGSLAVMYLLGYSLDILSLMALTIAVGFAVDDTVVVVENIARHIENGMPPLPAAKQGAAEVGLTVLAMSAVLVAVFIPLLLMQGYVGLFIREFAVTLAVVITISLLVSLSVVPMLCAYWLKAAAPEHERKPSRFYQWSEHWFDRLQHAYDHSLAWALGHASAILWLLLGVLLLNGVLYKVVPKGFFPRQDTGELSGELTVGGSASFALTKQRLHDFVATVRADPAVASVAAYVEHDSGTLFASLKPLSQRAVSADQVAARLNARLAQLAGANFSVNSVQNIRIGGHRSRSSNEYALQADDEDALRIWLPRILRALSALPQLRNVSVGGDNAGLTTTLHVERDTAAQLGVSFARIDGVLQDAFAGRKAAMIFAPEHQSAVVVGVAPQYARSPQDFDRLKIDSAGGARVPLSVLTRTEQHESALKIEHLGQSMAATISFDTAPGVSMSQATQAIQHAVAGLAMPSLVRRSFQGSAGAFRQVVKSEPLLILGALLMLYIVLGVLYESGFHPLTILSTLPSAGVGAVLALLLLRSDFDVIALIGSFALIGIVMKNAIMLVDFAQTAQRTAGLSPHEAIQQACRLRFRPILMTSLAVLLASLPLTMMHGNGAEMRQPLGIVMGGGIVMSQLLTLYTTPVVYLYLDRASRWANKCLRKFATRYDAGLATDDRESLR